VLSYKGASPSIDLWLDLREKFRSAFATSKERPKTGVDLRLIQQGPEEPL